MRIWLVIETWSNKGCSEGSPIVNPYATKKLAQLAMARGIKIEREDGLFSSYSNEDMEDVEVSQDDNSYNANDSTAGRWVDFKIEERNIIDNNTLVLDFIARHNKIDPEQWMKEQYPDTYAEYIGEDDADEVCGFCESSPCQCDVEDEPGSDEWEEGLDKEGEDDDE